jgi:hypothetical protein
MDRRLHDDGYVRTYVVLIQRNLHFWIYEHNSFRTRLRIFHRHLDLSDEKRSRPGRVGLMHRCRVGQ